MADALTFSISAACRIVGMDQGSLNARIFEGCLPCAPSTTPGRARRFDLDGLLTLWLFRERLDRSDSPKSAGNFACLVGEFARNHPEVPAISVVKHAAGNLSVHVADDVPPASEWDRLFFSGQTIHDVTTYNVKFIRELITRRFEEE